MPRETVFKLSVGETHVTLTRGGQRHVRTARILGRETTKDTEMIWLDRVVLDPSCESLDDGWNAGGAISTILARHWSEEGMFQ